MWFFFHCESRGFSNNVSEDCLFHAYVCAVSCQPSGCSTLGVHLVNMKSSAFYKESVLSQCLKFWPFHLSEKCFKMKHIFFYWFLWHLLLFPSWLPTVCPLSTTSVLLFSEFIVQLRSLQAAEGGYIGSALAHPACWYMNAWRICSGRASVSSVGFI